MPDGSDSEHIKIANDLGDVVAVAAWEFVGDDVYFTVATGRTFALVRADVRRLMLAMAEVAHTPGIVDVSLRATDVLVRTMARAHGFEGSLRADLSRVAASWVPADAEDEWPSYDRDEIARGLRDLLPGTMVTIEPGGVVARLARRFETGIGGSARVVAVRDGTSAQLVAPMRSDLMIDSLAAALDTMLTIFVRFAAVARHVPPVVFGMAAMDMVEGRISGQATGGRITINPAHVSVGALEALIRTETDSDPGARRMFRASRKPSGRYFSVDGVVAHEIGHSIDHLGGNGRIADSTQFRQSIGAALGVESVELALRGREPGAPPEWQRAQRELVEQISDYATTNGVELFAEIFKAWFEGAESPVTLAFDGLMADWFPPPA